MLAALVWASGGPVAAQLICYEGFGGYGADVQVENGGNGSDGIALDGGTGWGGPYNVSNAIKSLVRIENRSSPVNYDHGEIAIMGGNRALRFYDFANGEYAIRRPLGTIFNAAGGESLWFAFLFRTSNASPLLNRDFYQVGFDGDANPPGGNPRVSIGASTTSGVFPADFRFFARSTTQVSTSAFHTLSIASAVTYLLVGHIQPEDGVYRTVSLHVNPSTLDEPGPPSATVTLPSGISSLSHAFLRTVDLDAGDVYVMDEWRIGRDYGSVVGSLRNALRIVPATPPGELPTLRWSISLTGVVLETSPTLEPHTWTEISGPFSINGEDWEYPVPSTPGVTEAFFRLRR